MLGGLGWARLAVFVGGRRTIGCARADAGRSRTASKIAIVVARVSTLLGLAEQRAGQHLCCSVPV